MADHVLVNNAEEYGGLFVATRTFQDKDVVVSGIDFLQVYNGAKNMGIADPVVFYVPKKGMIQIYQCL